MIRIDDLFRWRSLRAAVQDGQVREQLHPSEPLAILNYTAQTQWERAWNEITRQCRGLIYNTETHEVVARPWPKFFNYGEVYGEAEVTQLDLLRPCRVFDKMDGSLGIAYTNAAGTPFIATRGSFTSDQAFYGNKVLMEKYPDWRPEPDLTYLFEIIYPGNRIVVDYGGMEDLVLLDILETDTGQPAMDHTWYDVPMPWVDELDAETLGEALELEPRANAEGIVVKFEGSNQMLKIKQEDYVALHRIVTGLNERTVWEALAFEGGNITELMASLPEEFVPWVQEVGAKLEDEFTRIVLLAKEEFQNVIWLLEDKPGGWTRKDFAEIVVNDYEPELRGLLFMLLDEKDIYPIVWKQVRPVNPTSLTNYSEDVA